mmetsp:Transcript_92487/g.238767  ORF Transcript_92487/g.238767 Transcript_92487/m.238767 type:complete len:111 (+) Transcript_92487:63-395(+)
MRCRERCRNKDFRGKSKRASHAPHTKTSREEEVLSQASFRLAGRVSHTPYLEFDVLPFGSWQPLHATQLIQLHTFVQGLFESPQKLAQRPLSRSFSFMAACFRAPSLPCG